MPRPCPLLFLTLALTLAPATCPALSGGGAPADTPAVVGAPRDETLAYLEGLPESNPYRATLLRFHTLPAADRDALKFWADASPEDEALTASLTPAQQTLAREFSSALVFAASRPPATAEDWPMLRDPRDPDNPIKMLLPGIELTRSLARLTVKSADTLPPGEAIAAYAAAAQFGRQQRAGTTLVEHMTGVAIEGIAFSAAGRRLLEFSPAELQTLSSAWSRLHPGSSIEQAVAGEKNLYFGWIVNQLIRPALVATLAETEESDVNAAQANAPADDDPDASFTRHLRLSGLVDLGDGERRISLENTATGTTFTISEGKRTDGIELVSLDFDTRQAVIRRGSREAVIHLETKRILERRDLTARFLNLLVQKTGTSGDSQPDKIFNSILERAQRHPGGANGYADELLAAYQTVFDTQIAAADSPKAPPAGASNGLPLPDDPFFQTLRPSFGKAGRTLNSSATSATILQAAIHHRLQALGQAKGPAPTDPWSETGEGFALEATPDGGFLLRSRYESKPDKPITYKFAAPDAGFVQAK